ncbi:hypothetical protein C9374_006241 [Naegleria lovaniensis]|uniref:Inner membrane component domain-containing protein n=1 Tax=Naegleria lovaniensis TaxID=51637 RepID=A0AA88GMR0_NAELO|nr:uncharacterized protein C9374_006241 [Naegleria lovaniensis]KAG2381252.1 hypothetical protein C9374_006241 [Naegleria lovaniensis]
MSESDFHHSTMFEENNHHSWTTPPNQMMDERHHHDLDTVTTTTLDDEYRDSFASLDDHPHYLHEEENEIQNPKNSFHDDEHDDDDINDEKNELHYGMTSMGNFVKSNIPTTELVQNNNMSTLSSLHHESNLVSPTLSKFRKGFDDSSGQDTPTDLSEVMLQDVDLGIPSVKIMSHSHPLNELKMLDDDGPSNQDSLQQQQHDSSSDKHKSVWSDLALQFLGRQVTDTFLTFEDSQQISVEMMQVLKENSFLVQTRIWLWRLSGGLLFSLFYGFSACLIFVIYGFCFSLPCVIQLFRIAKFMSFPFTKLETFEYVLSRLNESNSELLASASTSTVSQAMMQHLSSKHRLSSVSSPIPQSTLEKSNSVKSIKEHRELMFNSREKHGTMLWIANIVWLLLFGWLLALLHLIFGGILILSVVGSEFGRRHLALVTLSLMPFGLSIKK